MRAGAYWRSLVAGLAAIAVTGCMAVLPVEQPPRPEARPAPAPAPKAAAPSPASEALQRYYARLQADLVTQGLLRTDGGGPDTPYSPDTLARNFETIAFFDEYAQGSGISAAARGTSGKLRRWAGPVRVDVSFGAGVPPSRQAEDLAAVRNYVGRLSRVTGHPISLSEQGNFHVLFASADDTDQMVELLRDKVPGISQSTLNVLTDLPRSIHCLVVAFSGGANPQNYTRAVAVIRAEHPDLLRLSCIHEELAQGLGLANDSPDARPSIFNDDDEFALLTSHDEKLLKMLYDPRLSQGMDIDTARPILRILSREVMGQPL